MKNPVTSLTAITAVSLSLCAQGFEPGSFEEKAASYSWKCVPQEGLPNVLLIGDSISIGYTIQVRLFLKGKANVYRAMLKGTDQPWNCGHSASILTNLDKMLAGPKWDVIHFNTGLHDLKRIDKKKGSKSDDPSIPPVISIQKYGKNLEKIISRMKKTGAKIVFATTTPYPEGVRPCRVPGDAVKYNDEAKKVMKKHNVKVNDLYKLTVGRLKELQQPKNVHFHEKGSSVIAKQIATVIASELGIEKINIPEYCTEAEAKKAGDKAFKNKDYEKALTSYDFAATLARAANGKARALQKVSACYVKLNKPDEAIKTQLVIINFPGVTSSYLATAYIDLARLYLEKKNNDEAKKFLKKASECKDLRPPHKKAIKSLTEKIK